MYEFSGIIPVTGFAETVDKPGQVNTMRIAITSTEITPYGNRLDV